MSNSRGYQLNKAATSHTLEDLRCHAPIAVSNDYEIRFGMISSADSKQPSQLEESNLGSPPPPLVELQSELCYLCLSGGFPGIVLLAECTSVFL